MIVNHSNIPNQSYYKMNLREFNRGIQFGMNNPLHLSVNSDHAMVGAKIKLSNSQLIMKSVNISNKQYHFCFGMEESYPFRHTHLFVPKNCQDQDKNKWLLAKTEKQLSDLMNDLLKDKVDVQIIVEGYYEFYKKLGECLGLDYKIISALDDTYKDKPFNVTAIVVDTTKYKIIESDVIQQQYTEDGTDKKSRLIVPWVLLETQTGDRVMFIGIHLPGCESQFPRVAVEKLYENIMLLHQKYKENIVLAGDFNTIPNNLEKIMSDVKLLDPKYPTHINPNNDVVCYDNVMYINDGNMEIELLNMEDMHSDTQYLIKGLFNSRMVYITNEAEMATQ